VSCVVAVLAESFSWMMGYSIDPFDLKSEHGKLLLYAWSTFIIIVGTVVLHTYAVAQAFDGFPGGLSGAL